LIVAEEVNGVFRFRRATDSDLRDVTYLILSALPMGKTVSYKALGNVLGLHPRTIAYYMKTNENPLIIPCHRVVRNNGEVGGYSRGGSRVKRKLLSLEGVEFDRGKILKKHLLKTGDDVLKAIFSSTL